MSKPTEQNIKRLRALADKCQDIGEKLKVDNLEIAEDIWHMEDTLHGIANELESNKIDFEKVFDSLSVIIDEVREVKPEILNKNIEPNDQ